MMRTATVSVLGLALLLAACGTSPTERGVTGAGIGAGAGAIVGAVTGLSVLQGALIGAAAGGLTGALTSKDVINLGDPIWATKERPANQAAVSQVQAGLAKLGYDPGPVDGGMGPRTDSAIRAYQRDNGLPVDGRPTYELARHINDRLEAAGG